MITQDYITISPAYGRDYKKQADVIADFKAGKDFVMESMNTGYAGSYCSVRDFAPGVKVQIYYAKQQKSVIATVPTSLISPTNPVATPATKVSTS